MRVLLSGYYGYGNLGDEALLSALARGLLDRGHEVRVLSGDPPATRALHQVPAAHRYRGLLPALVRCDALVSGGGGLLQDVSSRRSLDYYLGVIRLGRRLGKRVLVYGQSVGPLSARGRREVALALRGVPVAVRDRPSAELLGGLGIDSESVADAALLLAPPPPPPDPGAGRRPVLLVPRAGHPDLDDALARAGRRLQASGRKVALMALHPREDAAELERLQGALGAPVWQAPDPARALERVADAGYVLSARLHGLIFAAVAGVPFAGLVYDPKVAGFLADANAPSFTRPVDPAALAAAASAGDGPDSHAIGLLRRRAEAGLAWLDVHIRG